RSTHRNLAYWSACSVGPGGRGRGRGLCRQACRSEDCGRPPARRAPRSLAGTRGDDRYRSDRRAPAACTRSRGGHYRPRPHPVLSVDPAALHAPLKSIETLLPILYLKGISTGDFSEALAALLCKDAAGLSASAIGRLKDGWLDEHTAWQRRDLSATLRLH